MGRARTQQTVRARAAGRPRANPRPLRRPPEEEILIAAGRLFAEQGFARTSTRQIANAVGIRQPSIFHHFPSKEHILEALLERTLLPALDLLSRLRDDAAPSAKLYALLRLDMFMGLTAPYNVGRLAVLPELSQVRFRRLAQKRRQVITAVESFIRQGVKAGEMTSDEPTLSAFALIGLDEATLFWSRERHGRRAARVADHVTTLALRGLLRDPADLDRVREEATRLAPLSAL